MRSVKPGNCCTLVYTSGTTGMPKGVMLSHDNYSWVKKSISNRRSLNDLKVVSYLPLSHVIAQLNDITGAMMEHGHVYFADPDALQGSLVKTLLEVRPTIFFSVPRVWEKIMERMKEISNNNGWLKTKIATWAKEIGPQGTINEAKNLEPTFQFKLAKTLVYNNVKKALGLDQARFMLFGAAPLAPEIRQYFLSLNFLLMNGYGMSECSGPQSVSEGHLLKPTKQFMKEAGTALPGTEMRIFKTNPNDTEGEICYRGRHVFMGYYKNPQETANTIDIEGFLHSGDLGRINEDGVLFITGRVKELLITAAGENIPPVLIENEIKQATPILNNAMLIGDGKKFLTVLLTIKAEPDGKLPVSLLPEYEKIGSSAKNLTEALKCPKVKKYIEEGLAKANAKAISRAQKVQKFAILDEDFTVENGLLTPTLKLKRKEVVKKYQDIIDSFYVEAKL